MKRIIILFLCLTLLFIASCKGKNNNSHSHVFLNGKCECGEVDPNYVPPHTHNFIDGKCECGEVDPTYVPPHTHNFVEGKCECGEVDPTYVPPHTHNFIEGKCECGETDPTYIPPHIHEFIEGKCECGETDPNYVPPHVHEFKDGKCECGEVDPNYNSHKCIEGTWVFPDGTKCLETVLATLVCNECNEPMEMAPMKKYHNKVSDEKEATCNEDGYFRETCTNCDYLYEIVYEKTNIHKFNYEIISKATDRRLGYKQQICEMCGEEGKLVKYANNGVIDHGKLSVVGPDLVDEHGEKFQLVGLSTHGLQWFDNYVNYATFDALHNEFGINVIRLALCTAEGGYCEATPERKEFMYQKVVEGIKVATALDMYVIVDWHMVGAEDPNDKNPLYYLDESMEFFGRITEEFKDYNNILYEIMNEPNGSTTWADCKKYANQVIPIIRENTDGIILVGNPNWTSNLNVVMRSPLEGYSNIMYTHHFYAANHASTSQVIDAYSKGFPVFISEHGGMESSGDGEINYQNIEHWYDVLEARNISYVAWNLSNSKGSASILKHGFEDLTDFSDDALKEWGVWYKAWVRKKFGFDK